MASELKIEELRAGDGAEATGGKTLTMLYEGFLPNGTRFDGNCDSRTNADGDWPATKRPFTFTLGAGQVIKGWDQGLAGGFRIGGRRKLTIPPDLGYGARGIGPIPPNSTLVRTRRAPHAARRARPPRRRKPRRKPLKLTHFFGRRNAHNAHTQIFYVELLKVE